jgi:hypothetical protein
MDRSKRGALATFHSIRYDGLLNQSSQTCVALTVSPAIGGRRDALLLTLLPCLAASFVVNHQQFGGAHFDFCVPAGFAWPDTGSDDRIR